MPRPSKQMEHRRMVNKETNQQSYREKLSFARSITVIEKVESEMTELLKPVEVIEDGKVIKIPAPPIEPSHLAARKLLCDNAWKRINKLVSDAPSITAKDFLDWQNQHLLANDEIAPVMDMTEMRKRLKYAIMHDQVDKALPPADTSTDPEEDLPSFLK